MNEDIYSDAVKKSIEHWEKMIAVVDDLPKESDRYSALIFSKTGEIWRYIDCNLCLRYYNKNDKCYRCPLEIIGKGCYDENSIYQRVTKATKRSDLKQAMEDMIDALRECTIENVKRVEAEEGNE